MNLEAELHDAFSTYALGIPADAGVRLRAVDYKPRTGRLSPRLTVGALGGVAATAGTVISVVVLGGAQPAFAGWTASPTPASGTAATAADAACQAKLASQLGSGGGWTPVTSDVRGPFTVVIFQDGSSSATCFIGPSFTVLSESSGSHGSESVSGSAEGEALGQALGAVNGGSIVVGGTASGDIQHMTVAHLDSASDGPYTLAEGQIQSGVTGVTLDRSDGTDVQASTGGGWFVAWWPGSQDVTSAVITTPSGTSNQPVTVQPLPSPPAPGTPNGQSCSGNSTSAPVTCSGGGSGGPSASTQGG